VGHYDPALVLEAGYRQEAFIEGPLLRAMREGRLLYIEELNRVPEETLNVLITALAEGEVHVPRVGVVRAASGFRLVAAMNPFDTIGTARIGQAVYDRMCRVVVTYQSEPAEREIVDKSAGFASPHAALAVKIARATREHRDVRTGSSVRGAIDMVRLVDGLCRLRSEKEESRETLARLGASRVQRPHPPGRELRPPAGGRDHRDLRSAGGRSARPAGAAAHQDARGRPRARARWAGGPQGSPGRWPTHQGQERVGGRPSRFRGGLA